jgi:predicted GH43/DUF377 family glycosyl hydrolase
VTHEVPYTLTRLGVVMSPTGEPLEAEGVLNPGSGRGPNGATYLLPRLVAAGNVSRIGLARLQVRDGVPVGVEREGVVLAPDEGWERSRLHAGVEDPRITWLPSLRVHVMTYVAYGALGPRPALAVSENLRDWQRLGPVHFQYDPALACDLNLFHNKDVVLFPQVVTGPDDVPCYAMLHRPSWDMSWLAPTEEVDLPRGLTERRPGIWISYVPANAVARDIRALTNPAGHRLVALPEFEFEALKIGAGPPPIRVVEGWLLVHHGVQGQLQAGVDQQQGVYYSAGAMLLDLDDPSTVLARTAAPLMEPDTADERAGIVPNVVFPTAIEQIDGKYYVFYGMADSKIGVARLDRVAG